MKIELLRRVNYVSVQVTKLIGIIVRSSTTRNAFEFYKPFLNLCRRVLDEDCHLILSSEWEYVPFTYPQNLQELPNFVIIGLPAPESENILIFPAAGHELGHSIWLKEKFRTKIEPSVRKEVVSAYRTNHSTFQKLFPDYAGADIETDMFAQTLVSDSVRFSLRQCEEYFSDFVGLLIFGAGYIKAYEYLLAPTFGGLRSSDYPENKIRAGTLANYAEKMNIKIQNYEDSFVQDQRGANPYENFMLDMADAGTEAIKQQLFQMAKFHLDGRGVLAPEDEKIQEVCSYFKRGHSIFSGGGFGSSDLSSMVFL